jgi:DNA-binding CsgD family transcriptional regulator
MNKEKLSELETVTVNLLLDKHSHEEIARVLDVSVDHLNQIIQTIQSKWRVQSISGILLEAIRRGYSPSVGIQKERIQELILLEIISFPQRSAQELDEEGLYKHIRNIGLFEINIKIDEAILKMLLKNHPVYMRMWLAYSMNKSGSGWHCENQESGIYRVYNDPNKDQLEFTDIETACAAFIVREIEHIQEKYKERYEKTELSSSEVRVLNLLLLEFNISQISNFLEVPTNDINELIQEIQTKWEIDTMEELMDEAIERGYRPYLVDDDSDSEN